MNALAPEVRARVSDVMPSGRPRATFYRVVRDVKEGRSTVYCDGVSRYFADVAAARDELAFWREVYDDVYLCEYEVREGSYAFHVMLESAGCAA